jgi:hypothetical protein
VRRFPDFFKKLIALASRCTQRPAASANGRIVHDHYHSYGLLMDGFEHKSSAGTVRGLAEVARTDQQKQLDAPGFAQLRHAMIRLVIEIQRDDRPPWQSVETHADLCDH